MNIIQTVKKSKEHILIWSLVLFICALMIAIQFITVGLTQSFWLSLLPNVVVDMIFFLIASYFISYLIRKNEKRKTKIWTYKTIGSMYENLVISIARDYINLITKEPCKTSGSINNIDELILQLNEIEENINTYVTSDFFKKDVNVIQQKDVITSDNLMDQFEKKNINTLHFNKFFQDKHIRQLDNFILKYISVLPQELREKIFILEDGIQKYFFTTLNYGVDVDVRNISGTENLFKNYRQFTADLTALLEYFKDLEK